jgi:arsenate reductase
MRVRIYHNPRCSKSRQTLALLNQRDLDVEVIEYLKEPPDAGTLLDLADRLGVSLHELLRAGEDDYKSNRDSVDAMTDPALAAWLSAHPKVIQRPIVVSDKGARVGRPPEAVLDLLD